MLAVVGLLLVVWIVFIVLGALVHGLLWLLIVGIVLMIVTGAVGYLKRGDLGGPRR
ncbi:hypothetical protein [Tomitella gaofuii]|uniref:hypothetical protein n=1 Tax=Tomitella gaofuii TaxID=2760083 RepID=UPI0015F9FE2A|nr:hypothetical protein [Tomitella gaofuii]